MIDRAAELKPEWVAGKSFVGVTAGASAPEVLVQEVIARLAELGARGVRGLGTLTPSASCSRCRKARSHGQSEPSAGGRARLSIDEAADATLHCPPLADPALPRRETT
jgi:hypothetical protein